MMPHFPWWICRISSRSPIGDGLPRMNWPTSDTTKGVHHSGRRNNCRLQGNGVTEKTVQSTGKIQIKGLCVCVCVCKRPAVSSHYECTTTLICIHNVVAIPIGSDSCSVLYLRRPSFSHLIIHLSVIRITHDGCRSDRSSSFSYSSP